METNTIALAYRKNARVRYTVNGIVHIGFILVVDHDPSAEVWVSSNITPDQSFMLPRCTLKVLS